MTSRFNRTQHAALFLAAGGRCQGCGRTLERGWHADHIVPVSKGGLTVIENGRATCGKCNQRKGARMPIPLRRWQEEAISAYFTASTSDYLLVATPGAGKTRVAGEIVRESTAAERANFVVIVVPTAALRGQWADALGRTGLHIDPTWKAGDGIPPDVRGIVVTYQAVAASPLVLRKVTGDHRTLVILDELHHCGQGDQLVWGDAIAAAFAHAPWRLGLSGTPFRSDDSRIPFVRYEDGVAVPDFVYGYGRAVAEGVCRHLYFPSLGGRMEWAFGDAIEATAIENADGDRRALRTAIMAEGGWIARAVDDAQRLLSAMRAGDPDAAGLIVTDNVEHAKAIAAVLRTRARLAPHDVVIVSYDDDHAPAAIARFRDAHTPWIVAVRMVSEGVDFPRVRVVVWATAQKTELLFRQVVGRAVRCQDDHDDHTAQVILPADHDLLTWAQQVAEERNHALTEQVSALLERHGNGNGDAPEPPTFTPISAQGSDHVTIADGIALAAAEMRAAERAKVQSPATSALPTAALALFARNLHVEPAPAPDPAEPAQHERRASLRRANNQVAKAIGVRHGVDHGEVQGRLNRTVGIASITDASIEQLETRLRVALRWRDTGDSSHVAH